MAEYNEGWLERTIEWRDRFLERAKEFDVPDGPAIYPLLRDSMLSRVEDLNNQIVEYKRWRDNGD